MALNMEHEGFPWYAFDIMVYGGKLFYRRGGTCLGSSVRNIVNQLCLNIKDTFFFLNLAQKKKDYMKW